MDEVIRTVYFGVGIVVGILVFFGAWLYAISEYGMFLGIGLGWAPSLVIAYMAGLTWPFMAAFVAYALA